MLHHSVFLIIILTASMFDSVSFYKIQYSALVPDSAQGRVAASHFQFEV